MFSSIISAATRHILILLITYAFVKLIPSLYSWLTTPTRKEPWKLTYASVLEARSILKTTGLPTELALQILDHAEYWPSLSFSSHTPRLIKARATHTSPSAATLCLAAPILNPDSLHTHGETPRVKAIDFHIRSRDQGWTSEPTRGTFHTSSWTEVSLLRGAPTNTPSSTAAPTNSFGSETDVSGLPPSCWLSAVFASPASFLAHILPRGWNLVPRPEEAEQGPQEGEGGLAWFLQGNRVATAGSCEEYSVRWIRDAGGGEEREEEEEGRGGGEGFVESVREGDWLLVWARAKWPGWQCVVEHVEVTVHYGFS
ncbi:hypothetical protein G6514_000446 [Epicoccum nigrum]|nr:hypothetical protein G6514_000446 [Epicoccum nigrum]